jgi:hypothetical protein
VETVCGGTPTKAWSKKQKESCDQKYFETFLAKLSETYPAANANDLSLWCKANPFECPSDWKKLEQKARDLDELENLKIAAKQKAEADEQDLARRRAAAMMIMGMQYRPQPIAMPAMTIPRPVTCSSNNIGGTVFTNCH